MLVVTNLNSINIHFKFQLFVGDRKTDEDLCQTTRFKFAGDKMLNEIATFGESESYNCAKCFLIKIIL